MISITFARALTDEGQVISAVPEDPCTNPRARTPGTTYACRGSGGNNSAVGHRDDVDVARGVRVEVPHLDLGLSRHGQMRCPHLVLGLIR